MAALMAAQCKDILDKLPDGLDTQIGTEGTYLSGGEQQRIALARAILKDAPIVVLDEATAFADPENEVLIQKAFATLTKGRTVIMIAHRLSTVVVCMPGCGLTITGQFSGKSPAKRRQSKCLERSFSENMP